MEKKFDKVFVINLKSSTDRRKKVKESLKEMGIPSKKIVFINATDREDSSWKKALKEVNPCGINVTAGKYGFLSKKYQKLVTMKNEKERKFWRGAVGNYLSHLRVLVKIGNLKKSGKFLILEDDICPTKFWYKKDSADLMDKVPDAQFIYLGDCWREGNLLKKSIKSKTNELIREPADCLHAYMVTTTFCLAVKGGLHDFFPLRDASDTSIKYFMEKFEIPWYNFKKALIVQSGVPSDIGSEGILEDYPCYKKK